MTPSKTTTGWQESPSHPCQLAGRLVRGESGSLDDRREQEHAICDNDDVHVNIYRLVDNVFVIIYNMFRVDILSQKM